MEIIKTPGIESEKDYRATVKIWRTESERRVPNSLPSIDAFYMEGGQPAAFRFQRLPKKWEMVLNYMRRHYPFITQM